MNRLIFQLETGLEAEQNKETYKQWQINKRLEQLNEAVDNLRKLAERMNNFLEDEERKKGSVDGVETNDTDNQPD